MSLSAEQEAAFRANTTTGDPFDVHSASVAAWRNVWTLLDEERARTNAMRDALEKGNRRLGYWCDLHGSLPEDVTALGAMQAAIASTPAADLAAYRKSVLEEAALVCETCNRPGWANEEVYQDEMRRHGKSWKWVAEAIRALAAQAQEVK